MRNSLTIQQFLESDASVLHYGLPDLLALSPQSEADLQQLQAVLHKGLSLYEPRMSQVLVRITPEPARPYAARANIGAAVALGDQLCRVEFDVSMDAGSFAVGVSA